MTRPWESDPSSSITVKRRPVTMQDCRVQGLALSNANKELSKVRENSFDAYLNYAGRNGVKMCWDCGFIAHLWPVV